MSLDVHLEAAEPKRAGTGIFVREDGSTREITREEWDARFPGLEPVTAESEPTEVYWRNITHNLCKMASAAGIYDCCWRPDEVGITTARQIIEPLSAGLKRLRADPVYFRTFNPENGWGSYEGLVDFADDYLAACQRHPDATVRADR